MPKRADILPVESVWAIIKQDLEGSNTKELRAGTESTLTHAESQRTRSCVRMLIRFRKRVFDHFTWDQSTAIPITGLYTIEAHKDVFRPKCIDIKMSFFGHPLYT